MASIEVDMNSEDADGANNRNGNDDFGDAEYNSSGSHRNDNQVTLPIRNLQ